MTSTLSGPSALVRGDRVHGSIYTDGAVFDAEMERIFGRTWVYVGHESEVPNSGDYKTTQIGLQPVILVRSSDDGPLRVFYNRCRHRAAQVCQSDRGTANYFRCAYHGWTYATDGRLKGVPFRDAYDDDFDMSTMGLTPVQQVASYRGFVFARLCDDGVSLEEHLGNAVPYLDRIAESGEGRGIELRAGVQRYDYAGNWKLQLENVIDNYHVSFVHKTFVDILATRAGRRGEWHDGEARSLGGGHAVIEFPSPAGVATGGEAFNLNVFPNLSCIGTQVRVVHPRRADHTLVEVFPTLLVDGSEQENAARLRVHEESFGPAGFVSPDDVEVSLERVQRGLAARGDEWLYIGRGIGRERTGDDGVVTGHITDEVGHRGMYQAWSQLMAEVQA